ncbi:MAG TPA: FAD-dependent oxidoreductase [Pyrinomonadaceae bacterium]|jgi:thioredoxin reductase (NADPH)
MATFDLKKEIPHAFPKLDDEQFAAIAEFAECKTYNDGDVLLRAGETGFMFHVVRSGAIEVIDRSGSEPRTILVHEPGEFTGDIANLTGRTSNVDAVAKGRTEVFEVCEADLRQIISERPNLSDLILQTFITRAQALDDNEHFTGIRVIGSRLSPDAFRIRNFLSKNRVLYTFFDFETDPEVGALLRSLNLNETDTPVVGYGYDWFLHNPSNEELAERVGIKQELSRNEVYDLAIVGGGPAGLAAAVYGASEGLKTIVLEKIAAGGQAATSSKIENYLGFPTGLSGGELAERATIQAEKFGAQLSIPSKVTKLVFDDKLSVLHLENGERVRAKAIIVATGADYRKLEVEGRERFDAAGVYYAATVMESQTCGGDRIAVVGGGNSAGQAAIFLSANARKVFMLIRNDDLSETMSNYLVERIGQTENIEVLPNTEISAMFGENHLEAVELKNNKTGDARKIRMSGIFSFIGATPRTSWLPPEIEIDEQGFIKTGAGVSTSPHWTLQRTPFYLESSRPGIFAAGDVRSGSVKRVASAVGEGAMALQFVHEFLKES